MFWFIHHIKFETIIFSILVLFFNIRCEKLDLENEWVTYTIKKGEHNCTREKIEYTKKKALHFKVTFDSSAIYRTSDSTNQSDINKLYGFTDCGSLVHENSARFGWRWCENSDSIELMAYCYSRGTVIRKALTKVALFSEVECNIKIENNLYLFEVGHNIPYSIVRGCNSDSVNRYICYPYFGGDESAPHDIKIKIMDL